LNTSVKERLDLDPGLGRLIADAMAVIFTIRSPSVGEVDR